MSPSAWKAKERPRSPYKKFEFSTLEVSRSSSGASLHVIVTFTMDPLAVLAGMEAMDAAGVPVEEIPDSDGKFDDRSLEGSDVDVLSSDEEELLDDELLGDGTSSGASGDSSQSGTEDSDEDSDEQNDGGAVRGRGRGARGGRGRGRGLGHGNPVGRGRGNLRGRGRGGRGRGAGGRGGAHANYDAAFGYNYEDDGGPRRFRLPSLHVLHVRCQFCVIRAVRRNLQFLPV